MNKIESVGFLQVNNLKAIQLESVQGGSFLEIQNNEETLGFVFTEDGIEREFVLDKSELGVKALEWVGCWLAER